MDDPTELVTWGSQETADRIHVDVPIPHKHISTLQKFRQYIAMLSKNVFIILLFLDPPDENLGLILAETRKKEDQIIRMFICCNPLNNLPTNQPNMLYISEYMITYVITSTIRRFLEDQSEKQFEAGNIQLGDRLEQLRKNIAEWFSQHAEVNDGLFIYSI
jgi:hypothetical protein